VSPFCVGSVGRNFDVTENKGGICVMSSGSEATGHPSSIQFVAERFVPDFVTIGGDGGPVVRDLTGHGIIAPPGLADAFRLAMAGFSSDIFAASSDGTLS